MPAKKGFWFCVAWLAVSLAVAAEPTKNSEVVAELWFLSARLPVTQPELAVFSDGLVRTVREDGQILTGQMTVDAIDLLRQELLLNCGLAQVETQRLAAEIDATGRRENLSTVIPNADETVIRIRLQSGDLKEVRCRAVPLLAVRFPAVASLQGLYRAQLRLENVRTVLQVGGDVAATQLAEYASASLQAQQPGTTPLTARDLAMVRRFPDGTRYIQFCRQPEPAGSSGPPLIVAVTEVPGDNPRVSVFGGSAVLR